MAKSTSGKVNKEDKELIPREIALSAYKYLMEVTPPTQKISDVRIEELSPREDENGKFWIVILSYDTTTNQFAFDKKREYKEFKVDPRGNVVSMKIYNPKSE